MKTATELTKLLNCNWYKAKQIAKAAGWKKVMKNTKQWIYDVSDEEIKEFMSKPTDMINKDHTLELYKLTLGWGNGIQPLQKRR